MRLLHSMMVGLLATAAMAAPKGDRDRCGPRTSFDDVALVTGAAGEKLPLGKGKAYLIAGDVVRVAKATGATTCVAYPGPGPKTTYGTVDSTRLVSLAADSPALQKLSEAGPSPHIAWAGEWLRGKDATLTINALPGGTLVVEGNAAQGQNVGEIRGQEFAVKGAVATPAATQPKDAVVCDGLKLYRLNNALFVTEAAPCGGVGVTFYGAYFKNIERRSKK